MAVEHTIRTFGQNISFPCKEDEAGCAGCHEALWRQSNCSWLFWRRVWSMQSKLVSGEATCKTMSRAHISSEEEGRGIALACCMYPKAT